jgi:DNA polymerase-1
MPETTVSAPRRTIAVIDGNSLMHRAFHAIPATMSAPDGTPTNAIFGFVSMFLKMVESFHPDGVICAFDKGKPRVRMEMLPQYKAQRPPMDPALHVQFPLVKELLGSMDVPVVELEGWEGDDILGTLARAGEQAGYEMYLITGDRDMYQLSTEHVKIVGTKKGLSDVAIMTPESVEDLYHGITPALVPDFYGLKGDSSDNIPGVPGIGPKKASALIVQYGSLDEVIAHAGEVKGKMGESLRAHVDDALISRKVATIRTDAPIDVKLSDAAFPTFDAAQVKKAFSELGFTGMTKRVLALKEDKTSPASSTAVSMLPKLALDAEATELLQDSINSGEWIGVAIDERREEGALFGMGHELWACCTAGLIHLSGQQADVALVKLVRTGHLAASGLKALLHVICPYDSSVTALIEASEIDPKRIFDVGVAAYLLESGRSDFSVSSLLAGYLPEVELPEPTEELPQAALDAFGSRLLVPELAGRLSQDGSFELFSKLEMPLLPVLLEMERTGLHADSTILAKQSAELGAEISSMLKGIREQAGEDFNIDSPMQLSHVLFDVIGLPTAGLKKTRSGYYSTNAKVLADLAQDHQIVADVLGYRERAKIKSTYLDALPALIAADGRIHTTLNQSVAATGRLSSSDPNLQNIPTRSTLGHRVRQAFTVPEGSVFLTCDYSQIELRLLAHLSGDEQLIKAFCEGEDFHRETAARVFGVPVSEVSPQMRSRAKAVNFGIVYGQQAFGLASSLKISRGEAQAMIDRYYDAYPRVRSFLDEEVALAHKQGWVATMYGRKRHIAEIHAKNRQMVAFGERTAMNHPMQGSAADIIKIAMIRVAQRLRQEGLSSKMVLQIHDELDFEVPNDEIDRLSRLVKETMEGVVKLKVPLVAEISYGKNWAEAK